MKNIDPEDGFDLKKPLMKFLNKWYLFASIMLICLSIAYLKIKSSPKIYEVYSILKLNVGSSKSDLILNAADLEKKEINIDDNIIEIKSTNFVRDAINNLDFDVSYFTKDELVTRERYKLDFPVSIKIDSSIYNLTSIPVSINILNNSEFELEYKIEDLTNVTLYSYSEEISVKRQFANQKVKKTFSFDQPIKEPELGLGFTVSLVGDPKTYKEDQLFFTINNPIDLTKKYLKSLNLETIERNSNIMYLRIGSNIIQKETAFLNTLMDVIIRRNLNQKNQEALKTIDFIDFQLANVSTSLNKAESDLESIGYAAASIGESSVLYEQRNLLESQISSYNVQLQNLRNFMNNLESIEGSPSLIGSLDIEDQLIENLLIKLTDLYQQKVTLKRTATEANPIIQRVNSEIASTNAALRNALNGAINNNNVLVEDLSNRLLRVNTSINKLPSAERRKLGIQRKFEFSDNTYDLLMQRKATAGIALATADSDWSIIEYAKNDGDLISPKINFIYLLSFFLGLLIPALLITIIDQVDNRIKGTEDVKDVSDIPILGSIVKGNKTKKLATDYSPRSALLESFRELKINLQYLSSKKSSNIIGFTSSTSGEGKTFCAVNLGIIFAQSGKKVLVLDADLRNSSMREYFDNANSKHGLTSYLIGNSSIKEITDQSGIKNLDLIFSGAIPPNPSDILSLPKTEDLLHELRSKYDIIIVDSPPVGLVGDYLLISKFVDVNLYIARNRFTKKKSFEKINNLYESKMLSNLSIVVNEIKVEKMYGSNPYYVNDSKTEVIEEILSDSAV